MNRDEYDAVLKRGIRLGLEAAERAIEPLYDPQADDMLRNLNPDTIARDVQTTSHQERCDDLHIAREAQDMGSEKEVKDD